MRPKTLALLAVAAMCGLVAMMGVQQVLSKQGEAKSESGLVLVAKSDIPPGQPLDDTMVEFKEWPSATIPEGAINKKEQFQERALKVRAVPGSLILEAMLDKKGVRSASSQVPKGMKVVSVPIDPTMTASGIFHPGDRVDVLVTYRSINGSRDIGIGKEVKTVLAGVEVFAVDGVMDATMIGRAGDPKASAVKNVMVLVTKEQASLLKLAQDVGALHLTLGAMNDDSPVDPKDLFDPSQAEHVMAKDTREVEERDHNAVAPVELPVLPPIAKPMRPNSKKWKIEIIAGKERRIDEVEVQEELPETSSAVKGS